MTEFDSKPMRGSKSALLSASEVRSQTDKRFKETKTGLIGAQRETMLTSELQFLVRNFPFFFIFLVCF